MMMKTLIELLAYLEKYNKPFEEIENTEESRIVIKTLRDFLKDYPDYVYRLKGSYDLSAYEFQEYELFYTSDMYLFRKLLEENRYNSFIHEIYDFLRFKIFKNDIENEEIKLPRNIKFALIHVIKTKLSDM